ncbi:hypothetical protein OS493_029025 [Desmophyllum pertusum]|uniref:Uncharacterized protein n=1 Tax=Desmophyllum pertusum TaxID=174260 RepID=A0A9W9YKG7_9CNID|nr:hypothetical protein OS493_029025 [Desmophyllum pertusum]
MFSFFAKNEEGHVVVYYKKGSTSPTWLPKDGIIMTDEIPRGEPDLVPPNLAKIKLDKIKADLTKFCLKFDHSTNQWWSDFIKSQETRHDEVEWKLSTLLPPTKPQKQVRPRNDDGVEDELRKFFEKEEREVEVNPL